MSTMSTSTPLATKRNSDEISPINTDTKLRKMETVDNDTSDSLDTSSNPTSETSGETDSKLEELLPDENASISIWGIF